MKEGLGKPAKTASLRGSVAAANVAFGLQPFRDRERSRQSGRIEERTQGQGSAGKATSPAKAASASGTARG